MTEKALNTTEPVAAPESAEGVDATREARRYQIPPVDIHEVEDGLVVTADLPGVEPGGLEVKVDNGLLTIVGHVSKEHDLPQAGYREFEMADYYRQFKLHEHVDVAKISAELKHGVLRVVLPHAEAARSRQVEVKVA